MGVVGANIAALMATRLLKAYPDIRLDVFQHMTKMDGAVGVGKSTGYKNLAVRHRLGISEKSVKTKLRRIIAGNKPVM